MKEDITMEEKKVVLLTIREAAAMVTGLSVYQVRLMIKNGQIPYIKAGTKIFINKDILLKVLGAEN